MNIKVNLGITDVAEKIEQIGVVFDTKNKKISGWRCLKNI